MAFSLAPMSIDDYPNMISLWNTLPGIGLSGADTRENIAGFLKRNANTCFVAKSTNQVIGTILGGIDGRRGYIYHLAVEPSFQKSGWGKKLVEAVLGAMRSEGIQKSHIFVIASNQEGIEFWQHIGWTLRDDILIMSRDL